MSLKSRATTASLMLLVTTVLAGCAGTTGSGVAPSATVTTAMAGWEEWARVDWTAQPRAGGSDIEGYVTSHRGHTLINVRVLAQGLDASGNVVGQKIEWIPSSIPAMQSTYFRVPGMAPAAQYRVSVWTFDTVESTSWM